jgi:DNA-directed RNA polymerase subunit K/omega
LCLAATNETKTKTSKISRTTKQKHDTDESSSDTESINPDKIVLDDNSESSKSEVDSDVDNNSDSVTMENETTNPKEKICIYDKNDIDEVASDCDLKDIEKCFDDDNKLFDTFVDDNDRITFPIITKYEHVRVICDRAKHLSCGAKPMISNVETLNSKQIAEEEFKNRVLPFIIVRTLPNGKKEKWKLSELELIV